jgi:pyruvate formate lyase activating enzyme
MRAAILWEAEGERIRCRLCPNACLIAEGKTGTCGVRRNSQGTLEPVTYGLVSSIAADPIEKKPVFHYHPGTAVLSLGSVGCSMRCGHCQNWRISRSSADEDIELRELPPQSVVDMARTYSCPGVAFTYNEPVIWAEYVIDVAQACREAGLFTVMVTNGYVTQDGLDAMGPLIDVWRVDLKGSRDETYRSLCHVSSVAPVLAAAERARHHWGMHVEVATNVVPTVNDSTAELREMAEWIAGSIGPETPWHITRFFPYLEYSDLEPTPLETLRTARMIGRDAGLRFVYLGNITEPGGEDTVCPQCGAVAVRRTGYTITARHTREGGCARCAQPLNIAE